MSESYATGTKPVDQRYAAFLSGIKLWNVYSQFCEDSLIEAIFRRIGTANQWCLEVGAADGLFFSNTRLLINQGWTGILIESDPDAARDLRIRNTGRANVIIHEAWAEATGPSSLDNLLAASKAPAEVDLLVIDVDGQDYYLFNSLVQHQPRVVICEYDPNAERMFIPELGGEGQAGLDAIRYVANARGYEAICATRTNLICVRRDLAVLLEEPGSTSAQAGPEPDSIKVAAVMSTPRLGFLSNSDCILSALAYHGIPLARGEGAWWQHSLTRAIERQLEAGATHILTIDYDTVFTAQDVAKLVCFLDDNPIIDVAVAMQQKREGGELLASTAGEVDLSQPGIPILAGHFGLTLFRRSVFERLSKPWFYERPDDSGGWGAGRVDADMGFWENCYKSGVVVYLALNTVVGHLEQVVTWPDVERKPLYQSMNSWRQGEMKPPAGAYNWKKAPVTSAKLDMGA